MKLLRRKKFVIPAIVGIVALIGAGVAYGFFTTSGSGTGSAPIGDAIAPTVTVGTPIGNPLYPTAIGDPNAVIDIVPYTVTNTGDGNVNFNTVTFEVTPGFSYVDGAGDPACTAADFSIGGQPVNTPFVEHGVDVSLQGSSDTPANTWNGNFTIQMVDNGANQDSCESGSVPLTVTVGDPVVTASLSDIVYYTLSSPTLTFSRYLQPTSIGDDSQSLSSGPDVKLSVAADVNDTSGDNGFYMVLGTLGNLSGYTIGAVSGGSDFGSNIYFGTHSPTNDFFDWSGANNDVLSGVGNTNYGLGPTSSAGTLAVTGASSFFMVESPCAGDSYTLTQLQAGACGMTSSTPVAIWVGMT